MDTVDHLHMWQALAETHFKMMMNRLSNGLLLKGFQRTIGHVKVCCMELPGTSKKSIFRSFGFKKGRSCWTGWSAMLTKMKSSWRSSRRELTGGKLFPLFMYMHFSLTLTSLIFIWLVKSYSGSANNRSSIRESECWSKMLSGKQRFTLNLQLLFEYGRGM